MENTRFKISQYACAVLLIVSSIALVAYQVIMIDDVSNGLLVYVAQAFLPPPLHPPRVLQVKRKRQVKKRVHRLVGSDFFRTFARCKRARLLTFSHLKV